MKSTHLSSLSRPSLLAYIKSYDRLLASVAVILGVAVLTYFFLLPTLGKARDILTQQQTIQPRLQLLSQKESQLAQLDVQQYRSVLERIQAIIPQSKDFVSLFSTFDDLEVKTGVSLRGTDFQLGVVSTRSAQLVRSPKTGAYAIPLQLSLDAQPDQMMLFLQHMSDFTGRLMTVDTLQWATQEDGSVRTQLSGKAYFLPLSQTIGAIDTPLASFSPSQTELFNTISALPLPVTAIDATSSVPTGKTNLFE